VWAFRFCEAAGCRLDELMKQEQYNGALDRLDELIKQLQNGLLDSDATADMIETLTDSRW
jgi:hypothetical protein